MVISLVNKAIVDYPAREVEEAIAYAAGNVRGGSMQFRAYLDKTLQNKWAEGYFESMQERSPHGILWTQMPRGGFHNGFVTGSRRKPTANNSVKSCSALLRTTRVPTLPRTV